MLQNYLENHIKQFIDGQKSAKMKGLEGLKPSFAGGRPSKLTYDQIIELDKLIEKTLDMSMKDVHILVKEKFNVDYSLKQIGKITKKLGYNYAKACLKFSKHQKMQINN